MLAPLLAALQAAAWTAVPAAPHVGDTVVIARRVAAAPRATVSIAPLDATEAIQPLGPPQVIPRSDGAVVRYTVAFFRTGSVTVRLPSIMRSHPELGADPLPADSVVVHVASVLPPQADPDSLAPRISVAPLSRPARAPGRLLLPVAVVLLLLLGWAFWRRRPRPARARDPDGADDAAPPTARWLAAGEARISAAWGLARLRQVARAEVPDAHDGLDLHAWRAVVGVHRPAWPLRKLDDLIERLERARFAPLGRTDVEELLVEVEEFVGELGATDTADA